MTDNFARAHRFAVARWVLDTAFDLQERLNEANHRRLFHGGAA